LLARKRQQVLRIIREYGGRNPRIFGSVAAGADTQGSDIDLLIDFDRAIGLFELARLERKLQDILGCPVDAVSASSLRPNVRARVQREAMPL